MAYIGTKPTVGNFQICDAISVVNGQAAYTMQVGSVNVIPQSANHMIVSLNGTIQKPNSSYTVSGSTITFASNLATGDVIDFIQILGDVLDLGVPSDGTVTTAKLADSSVSLAKLTATGTKDATTFLRGDNTFAEVTSPDVVLLASSGSLTSGSRFNADNIFSSTYKSYKIIGTNLRPSGDYALAFIFRTGGASGSDTSQSKYNFVHNRVERNSGGTASAITLTDWDGGGGGRITQDQESGNASTHSGFEFQVFNPILNNTTNWINHSIAWDSTASWIVNMIGGGIYNYSESITGIGFFWTAGTFADGEIKIYGFK
jgi:hypothetical protein